MTILVMNEIKISGLVRHDCVQEIPTAGQASGHVGSPYLVILLTIRACVNAHMYYQTPDLHVLNCC